MPLPTATQPAALRKIRFRLVTIDGPYIENPWKPFVLIINVDFNLQ
ncbi:hypothetical protein ACFS07_35960 [Undibacterium arcticum]